MNKPIKFTATIIAHESGGAFVEIPFDVEDTYGKKRVKIKANIEGEIYRGSLVRMGSPKHILLIRKDIRARIGKEAGDQVTVEVEEDLEPRVVKVPDDLQKMLANHPDAKAFFDKLSYTHQKEYVQWIMEAKRVETRERRIQKTITMLLAGEKR